MRASENESRKNNESRAFGRGTLWTARASRGAYQPRPDGSQEMVRVSSPRVRENTLRTGIT